MGLYYGWKTEEQRQKFLLKVANEFRRGLITYREFHLEMDEINFARR